MSMWITGANGFIGRHLARELAAGGHAVHGIGHGALDPADERALGLQTWINGEVDAANLGALAAEHGLPSLVFHLAGGSSVGLSIERPFEDFSRTVASTARLLEWLRSSAPGSRLVVVSSAAVYGADHAGPIAENAAPSPMSPYGHHKLMMEQLCHSYVQSFGLRCMVVRLFSVYGPSLRKQLLWDICSRLRSGQSILNLGGTGAEIRDWTDVRDVVRLLARVAKGPWRADFDVINGGSGRGVSVAGIAEGLIGHWGGTRVVQFSGISRPGDPTSLLADNKRMLDLDFDWRVPLERGLADYVDWFKDHAGA